MFVYDPMAGIDLYAIFKMPAMFCTPIAESMDGSKLATYATRQAEVPCLGKLVCGVQWLSLKGLNRKGSLDHLKDRPQ